MVGKKIAYDSKKKSNRQRRSDYKKGPNTKGGRYSL
jgi:hypothetical protein